jgi:hypothetical protein
LVLDCFAESRSFFPSPSKVHEGFFQRADFAEPFVLACFGESFLGVVGHVLQAPGLCMVHLQEAAFDAGVFVNTGGCVGAVAGTKGDPAQEEVLFEFRPLSV